MACKEKLAVMDQGGELCQSAAIKSLFKKYGYQVLPTGADSSFQRNNKSLRLNSPLLRNQSSKEKRRRKQSMIFIITPLVLQNR